MQVKPLFENASNDEVNCCQHLLLRAEGEVLSITDEDFHS